GVPFTTLISSQGKLHFPCAAPQLSFCSSRPGTKRTPLRPRTESTTEYDSRPFVRSNPGGRSFCLGGDAYSVSAFPNHHHPAQQGTVGSGRRSLPERREVIF